MKHQRCRFPIALAFVAAVVCRHATLTASADNPLPPTCAAAPAGLVAWWPGESNTWDVVGGLDGIYSDAPAGNPYLYRTGQVGSAFNFIQGRFVTVPANPALDLGSGDGFTFEAWIQPISTASTRPICGWGTSGSRITPGVHFQISSNDAFQTILVQANRQTTTLETAPLVAQAKVWQHVALSCNTTNGEMAIYVNGVLLARTNLGSVALLTSGNFNLGSSDGSDLGLFLGGFDEPALYRRALTEGEIQSIYLTRDAGKCPLPTPPCAPSPPGVVAWWPGESNTWDVAGGFIASYQPPISPTSQFYSPGFVGGAFRFQNNWQLTVAPAPELDLGTGAGLTFEAWINPAASTSSMGIFGWGGPFAGFPPAPFGVRLLISFPGILQALVVKTDGQPFLLQSASGAITAQQWQHVALTCNTANGDVALYLDGVMVATQSLGATYFQTTGPFGFGSAYGASGPRFTGLLDEPTLYNRALTAGEILLIHNAGRTGKCPLPPRECHIMETDIAGWWRGESNALDSVTINHGNMRPFGFPPALSYSAGRYGTAFRLRSANFVSIPASPSLNVGSGPGLTVEAWINNPANYSFPIVEWNSGTGAQGVYLASGGSGNLEANLPDDQGQAHVFRSPSSPAVVNQWRHVGLTYDAASGVAALFLDGALITRTNLGTFTPLTTGNLYLGFRPSGNYPGSGSRFYGLMDEVTVYRRALSPEEMRCVFLSGDEGKFPPAQDCVQPAQGIVGWWRGESNGVDSVLGNTGLMHSSPQGTYTNGQIGIAFATGSRQWFDVRSPVGLDVGKGPGLTVEAWINRAKVTPASIVSWSSPLGVSLDFDYLGPGRLSATLRDTQGQVHYVFSASSLVKTSQWQHVALTYDQLSGWASLFVNGNIVTASNLGSFTPETSGNFEIGNGRAGYFTGGVDETAIYERALSSFEIATIYRAANGRCQEPPTIVSQPESQRVNVGSNVSLSVEAAGNPALYYQWYQGPQTDNGLLLTLATNSVLLLTNVSDKDEHTYWVRVTNAFGVADSSNATLRVNYPPVADASATPHQTIFGGGACCEKHGGTLHPTFGRGKEGDEGHSKEDDDRGDQHGRDSRNHCPICSQTNAVVILDGSRSSDPDGDALTYQWISTPNSQPSTTLATGAVAVVKLPAGIHLIDLVVNDGLALDTNTVTITVLTAEQAVQRLLALVEASSLKHAQPLLASLKAALASIQRGNCNSAVGQLHAFQNKVKVRAQVSDGALSLALIHAAGQLIAALQGEAVGPVACKVYSVDRLSNGQIHFQFNAAADQIYLVEASTNLLDWETIGVATVCGDGAYEFQDADAARHQSRYYRIVKP